MLWITGFRQAIVPLYVVVAPMEGRLGRKPCVAPSVVQSTTIGRRRACGACGRRFTTFERVEEAPLLVLKRDASREQFDLAKLVSGLEKASKNRPIPRSDILRIAGDIEEALRARGQREVESQEIGIEVLNALRDLDAVAYMRFASVYKDFQDPGDFERELDTLESMRNPPPPMPS